MFPHLNGPKDTQRLMKLTVTAVVGNSTSSSTSALVFTAFAKIFLPWALKNMEELADERIH